MSAGKLLSLSPGQEPEHSEEQQAGVRRLGDGSGQDGII